MHWAIARIAHNGSHSMKMLEMQRTVVFVNRRKCFDHERRQDKAEED
jgi:hypothetical protein